MRLELGVGSSLIKGVNSSSSVMHGGGGGGGGKTQTENLPLLW